MTSITGVALVEMEKNLRDAWCCGASGGVKLGNKEYAISTAVERLVEAESSGADVLVTTCPLCIENFCDAKDKRQLFHRNTGHCHLVVSVTEDLNGNGSLAKRRFYYGTD